MALPQFKPVRLGKDTALSLAAVVDVLARFHDSVAAYASALTNERTGLLARGLTLRDNFRCQVVKATITTPDDWYKLQPPGTAGALATLGPGYEHWLDANYSQGAVRKHPDGRCESKGLIKRASGTGGQWVTFPAGSPFAGRSGDRRILPTTGAEAFAVIDTNESGINSFQANFTSWLSLAGLTWDANDRAPVPWPEGSQPLFTLDESFPGTPAEVLVLDAFRPDGLHLSNVPCRWTATTNSGRQAVRVTHVAGLAPLTKYTLTLAIFPG